MREELVSGLSQDFGVHAYGKWRGAYWRLLSLVDLGVVPGNPAGLAAAEQALDWLAEPRRLRTIHRRRIDGRVRRCASQDRGTEFLLQHRVVYSHRTGEPAHPVLIQLHFPPYWHYDLLVGLRTLAGSVGLADARVADALDVLESKRLPDGSWRCEGKWWKRPGSKGSNVEAVDWGDAAHELLTEQAQDALATARRL